MSFTAGQRCKYFALVTDAWTAHCQREGIDSSDRKAETEWRHAISVESCGCKSIKEMNHTSDFDAVMLELAIVAGDMYWLDRLASAAERRIKWVIEHQFIPDLEVLTKQQIGWGYIEGICEQAGLPSKIEDCPAQLLQKVLQMVDSHIRRLARKEGIKPRDLPSGYFRRGIRPGSTAQAKYRHDQHHRRQHAGVEA